jgi:hypothetical protein
VVSQFVKRSGSINNDTTVPQAAVAVGNVAGLGVDEVFPHATRLLSRNIKSPPRHSAAGEQSNRRQQLEHPDDAV